MDRPKDTVRDVGSSLPGILLITEMTANNIKSFFSVIVSGRYCNSVKVLFFLKQNNMTIGILPQLTSKMECVILDRGLCLANMDMTSLMKTFRERREILIVSVFEKLVLVTKSEMLDLLKIKIERELDTGTLIKRRIDRDIFVALLLVNNVNDVETDNGSSNGMSIADDMLQDNDSLNHVNITNSTAMIKDASKLSPVQPRFPHTTTFIDWEIIAFPNERNQYQRPNYPDRYPTQVTEIDAGQPSFESSPRHAASGSVDSGLSGVEQTNVYAAPDISYHRQTLFSSNVVTSGYRAPIRTKPPKYPEYLDQQKRQESFATPKWPVDDKPDPFLLAECGLFFTGNQDLVRCHQCGIGLKDWAQEDDVITEHVKHSSTCEYIVMKFGKNRIDRMKLALSFDDQNKTVSNAPRQVPYKIRSPRYQTMEARMASFKEFQKPIIKVPAQQLAVAGLFYTGKGDLCRCFTCDGGLKDWGSGDDPIKEHATYFPNCSYIMKLKGSEYVKQHNQQRNESLGASDRTIAQPTQTSDLPLERLMIADTSEYCSFTVSQVVQKVGYSKVEVKREIVELKMKGNECPTAEDIVNTLLDMQERWSEHVRASSVPKAAQEAKREKEQYLKEQLNKYTRTFVEHLSPGMTLDTFAERGIFTFVEIRDIREIQLTSDKNRAILQRVMMKGKRGYMEFIDCLRQSDQRHLAELLEIEDN